MSNTNTSEKEKSDTYTKLDQQTIDTDKSEFTDVVEESEYGDLDYHYDEDMYEYICEDGYDEDNDEDDDQYLSEEMASILFKKYKEGQVLIFSSSDINSSEDTGDSKEDISNHVLLNNSKNNNSSRNDIVSRHPLVQMHQDKYLRNYDPMDSTFEGFVEILDELLITRQLALQKEAHLESDYDPVSIQSTITQQDYT